MVNCDYTIMTKDVPVMNGNVRESCYHKIMIWRLSRMFVLLTHIYVFYHNIAYMYYNLYDMF